MSSRMNRKRFSVFGSQSGSYSLVSQVPNGARVLASCSRCLYLRARAMAAVISEGNVNRIRSPPRSKCFLAVLNSSYCTSSCSALNRCTMRATHPCSSASCSISAAERTKCRPFGTYPPSPGGGGGSGVWSSINTRHSSSTPSTSSGASITVSFFSIDEMIECASERREAKGCWFSSGT
jgi:hypothetical protein